jgi:Holliday junction resolvase RusA-like endonuclease
MKRESLRENAPRFHSNRPDALKLGRAVEDALTGILYADDSRIAVERLSKIYSQSPGVSIALCELDPLFPFQETTKTTN